MTLEQIKEAVTDGKVVHWMNDSYTIVEGRLGQWFIVCTANDGTISLTWLDGITMNGKPEEFYISE